MLRPGTYETADGTKVVVRRTATGYTVRYPDGTVKAIGGAA